MFGRAWSFIWNLFSGAEWRLSLWHMLFGAGGLLVSFSLPAWAVYSLNLFVEYQPLSWIVAGFAGAGSFAVIYFLVAVGASLNVRARYSNRMFNKGSYVDPMARGFESQRIFLNDFCLPSHPYISGKTFTNCEIVGPGILFMRFNNFIQDMHLPNCEAIVLGKNRFSAVSAFTVDECVFKSCSFKGVTFLFPPEDKDTFNGIGRLIWLTDAIEKPVFDKNDPKQISDMSNEKETDSEPAKSRKGKVRQAPKGDADQAAD